MRHSSISRILLSLIILVAPIGEAWCQPAPAFQPPASPPPKLPSTPFTFSCLHAATEAYGKLDAALTPQLDTYLKASAAVTAKGENPASFPIGTPKGIVAFDFTKEVSQLSSQKSSAYRQVNQLLDQCITGTIQPSAITNAAAVLIATFDTQNSNSPTSSADFKKLLAGQKYGGPATPLAPKDRLNIFASLGFSVEDGADIILDPKKCDPANPSLCAAIPTPLPDQRAVEFLFKTTRSQSNGKWTKVFDPNPEIQYFSGERADDAKYGAVRVHIPDDHLIGHIELPSPKKLFGFTYWHDPLNEKKHFIIRQVAILSEDDWGEIIKKQGADTALVFVHGYNTSFNDAIYRTAQIIWDLQYHGPTILFSWPSRGDILDYVYDTNSAYGARDQFISLLNDLHDKYGIKRANIIAHSMGNLLVLDSLASNSKLAHPVTIGELIMAAPDVDSSQFPLLAANVKSIAAGMTVYASSADKALAISKTLAGGIPRAGDVGPDGPIVVANVDSIDATAVGEEMFGINHDVFAAKRSLIVDIKALLDTGHHPPTSRTPEIHPVPYGSTPRYWRFVP
ncbi:Esterase/lipase superfamily enzyme [Rhizobiales bacterium GAS113]|nr:Esterase/lipase superfamily enzyme [Rhizobiales bacterium GAS113]